MVRESSLAKHTLSFVTYDEGGIDPLTNRWVRGEAKPPLVVKGNLQPFIPNGNWQIVLNDSFSLDGSYMFTTIVDLPVIDDLNNVQPTTTTIDGRTYYIAKDLNFSKSVLSTARHFYILAMMKMKDGSV